MVNIEPHMMNGGVNLDSGIIFYLYRGEYRIGVVDKRRVDMRVSTEEDNLVSEVNGVKTTEDAIYIIRPITNKIDFNNNTPLSENDKLSILKYGYGTYTDDQIRASLRERDRIHYYSKEDLQIGTNTFDLKGTD